jgi:hypothetical protein
MVNTLLLIVECLVGLDLVLERNLVDDCWNFGGRFESCLTMIFCSILLKDFQFCEA